MKPTMNERIAKFVREKCAVVDGARITTSRLWDNYIFWSQCAGLDVVLWSVFRHELTTYLPVHTKEPGHFSGIRIKDKDTEGASGPSDRSSPWDRC